MDLWTFYDRVEAVIVDLRAAGEADQANDVETALRGGSTGWEVLGLLSHALPNACSAVPRTQAELDALSAWVVEHDSP